MTENMVGLESVAAGAAAAAPAWAAMPPKRRAQALVAVADALSQSAGDLVATAVEETGLSEARLAGELRRTAVQLRLFADAVVEGSHLDVRIDEADADFALGSRPDVRRYRIPVGPIINFAASNFPFAFSVAGGDTAAALAAGCPVVLKAHSGHPRLSEQTAAVVTAALASAGAPDGTFQIITGRDAGVTMLKDPRIAGGSFTGSIRIGRMLADVAAARPKPIPFFGELGSVNPAFVTQAAVLEGSESIADGFVQSISGSAGQLCTKPGFLFLPEQSELADRITERVVGTKEQRLLNPAIAASYQARRETILSTPGVNVLAAGSLHIDEDGQGWATPTIVSVSADVLRSARESLLDEAFGPLSVLVEYDEKADLTEIADDLFEGNLTGTVHVALGEDTPALRKLVEWITLHAGRVVFNGWPTGVAVTPAMQHGGPWPATTNDSSTSVGTAAIGRFLRPVAYQGTPPGLLPEPLRDDNPWGVPQTRSSAGRSRGWGDSATDDVRSAIR